MRFSLLLLVRFGVEVSHEEYLAGWRDGHNEWDRLMGAAMHRMR